MAQIKVVLVGTDSISRQRITRVLQIFHGFKNIAMIDGVNKIIHDMYDTPTNTIHPTVKFAIYNALYAIDKDIFLTYASRFVARTEKNVVISDPHYVHEVEELAKQGFIIIRVVPVGKQRKNANYINSAKPGTVALYEWFTSGQGYKAWYSIPYDYENKDVNTEAINKMMISLKFKAESMYNAVEPPIKEGNYIEEEVSASDQIND